MTTNLFNYPAKKLLAVRVPADNVLLELENLPLLPAKVQTQVDDLWVEHLRARPKATPGELLVVRSIDVSRGKNPRMKISAGISNYKDCMGTSHKSLAISLDDKHIHRAISMMAITITKDNKIVLGKRSAQVYFPEMRHAVPAGRLRPVEENPTKGILIEFAEELGVPAAKIEKLDCLGVVDDLTYGHWNCEFVYEAHLAYTAQELIEMAKNAESSYEHSRLEVYPADPRVIRRLLLANPSNWVSTGWAGLALWLEHADPKSAIKWQASPRTYAEHMAKSSKNNLRLLKAS